MRLVTIRQNNLIKRFSFTCLIYPFSSVQVTDIRRLGNVIVLEGETSPEDDPATFLPLPLSSSFSPSGARCGGAIEECNIKYGNSEKRIWTQWYTLNAVIVYWTGRHTANRSVTKLDPFSTPNITARVNALLTQPPVPQCSANSHGSGIVWG